MNILLLGSGGREHALAWKMAQSPLCDRIYMAPGNTGTATIGQNLPFAATDFKAVTDACREHRIDMVVVGPEEPLVKGITDHLRAAQGLDHLLIIGPSAQASQLEGSKAFAKAFMDRHNIPTAAYREFTEESFQEGIEYLRHHSLPIVLKADGLAAGKGVLICQNHVEAIAEFELMIQRSKFGSAGKRVVVEEFLDGIEVSVFVLTNGSDYVILPEAKDYKRIGEGDTGLNTGGMGAVSPVPFADEAFMEKVKERIIEPTVKGLKTDQLDYTGFVFIGLMKVGDEPYVIEYNCRMGDPETEVVMPRIQSDLVQLLAATARGEREGMKIATDDRAATTIVAVSGGYPNEYEKGFNINMGAMPEQALLFHMGTAEKDGQVVTSGGRVVCVTGLGDSLEEALSNSREGLARVKFDQMYFRRDIGYEFTD